MATHSSIPAWKTPWTEEPGGSLASVTRETGSDESMTQSKPLEHNQTFVEMEEAQSFPWHLTLGGQTGQQLSVTISLPRGG